MSAVDQKHSTGLAAKLAEAELDRLRGPSSAAENGSAAPPPSESAAAAATARPNYPTLRLDLPRGGMGRTTGDPDFDLAAIPIGAIQGSSVAHLLEAPDAPFLCDPNSDVAPPPAPPSSPILASTATATAATGASAADIEDIVEM